MGSVDNDLQLRRPEVQRAYREAAAATGVRIGGVALDVMNQVAYKSDPRTEQWVSDASTWRMRSTCASSCSRSSRRGPAGRSEGQAEVVRRLKRVAPKAERNGVVLGIESWLNAADLVRILDAVGSPGVQVYYDVANSTQMGYDVLAEIRQLGRERILRVPRQGERLAARPGPHRLPRRAQGDGRHRLHGMAADRGRRPQGRRAREPRAERALHAHALLLTGAAWLQPSRRRLTDPHAAAQHRDARSSNARSARFSVRAAAASQAVMASPVRPSRRSSSARMAWNR